MKKTLLLVAALICATAGYAQVLKQLEPRIGKVFTDKGAEDFEKGKKLLEQKGGNATEADYEAAEALGYDEIYESYWDLVGQGDGWYNGTGANVTKSSGCLKSQGSNTYDAKNAGDLDAKTAWVEGVPGYGIGEWIEYNVPDSRITDVCVVNGYVKSQKAWQNNSRVKKLKVYLNGKPYAILHLQDSRSEQWFELGGEPFRGNIRFEIVDVYKGALYDDTAISEIYFNGVDVLCFAKGTQILLGDRSSKNIEDIQPGDRVMTIDPATGEKTAATVLATDHAIHTNLVEYTLENGAKITATADHPLLTTDGWKSLDPAKTAIYKGFDNATALAPGDKIITADGTIALRGFRTIEGAQPTYTIVRLSEGNTFFADGAAAGTEEVMLGL